MNAITQLQRASHFGIGFPYTRCRTRIKARHHAHVYIHTDGGELEKLGLALREFHFTIPAHDSLQQPYRNFYSGDFQRLWAKWQSLETGPLVDPSIGTVQAMASEATREIGSAASGESVDVSLIEDSRTLETISAVFRPSVSTLPAQLRRVVSAPPPAVPPSLLDRLLAAVNKALGYAARGDVMARQWLTEVGHVIAVCETIYRLPALALPANVAFLDALLELQLSTVKLRADAARRSRTVRTWPAATPARMSVVQLAAWIYGDTSRSGELLTLNDFDPFNVPRGSVVRYYV